MKKKSLPIIVALALIAYSCGTESRDDNHSSNTYHEDYTEGASAPQEAYYDDYDYEKSEAEYGYEEYSKNAETKKDLTATNIPVTSQMLIKTGNIGFESEDVYDTRAKVNGLIKQFNAYVSSESEDYYGNRINQYMTIRIPNKYFETFVDALCDGIDRFDNKNIYVEDVTDEFVDTETRIANKKALEQKYIALLEKAHTIEDILEIEQEINYLREDIELAEAHLKNLSSQISYSTLDLYIYEQTSTETHTEEPENEFVLALMGGWESVVEFFINLTYAWPALMIWGVVILIAITIWKKKIRPKLFGKD